MRLTRSIAASCGFPADKLFKIGDGLGLHPSMRAAADLLESGRLAIVQGVGYPNPNRSHFESMTIWQTAQPGQAGRRDARLARPRPRHGPARQTGRPPCFVGDENLPLALFARRAMLEPRSPTHPTWHLTLPSPRPADPPMPPGDDLAAFVNRTVTSAYATAAELEAAAARPTQPRRPLPRDEPGETARAGRPLDQGRVAPRGSIT